MRKWRSCVLAGVACALMVLVAAPAGAQETEPAPDGLVPGYVVVPLPDEVEVAGEIVEAGTPTEVAGIGTPRVTDDPNGTLPVTGGDLVGLAVLAAILLGLGALLASRRRARVESLGA